MALVDDDPHFQLFLESVFGASARHRVAATAGSAEEALRWSGGVAPHVVLLDIGLPGRAGSALVAELIQKFPGLLVIMLTAQTNEDAILESIRAGAVGYLLKGVGEEEIIAAIDDALAGGAPMTPAIARRVLTLMRQAPVAKNGTAGASAAELAILTEREREVLELVAGGAANKEVAQKLGIALSTAKNSLLSIYTKWRVRSRTEAAMKFRGAQ
ncbi:MAG: response regulator transcription factor [Undibacterium sp.]|nr:response regulator transcription factor [Opitutaceae bacterium]